ncbi:Uncharacterised protein [Acinetobacter baumannii]|nr:Uncharacterised protein [Acinetobacter baumannii]
MAQQAAAAQRRARQPQTIGAELALIEAARRAELRQHALAGALVRQQRLQPASEGVEAACQAAGGGKVQAGAGVLPALRRPPVTWHQPRHHVEPAFRRSHLHLQRLGDMPLHQLVEIIPFAAQRGLQQPIAGIAVGDLAAGLIVQSFQPLDKLHHRLRFADGVQRYAQQAERFAHVGQAAGHVQRLADGNVRQRGLQGGEQFTQALLQPNGAIGGVQRQRGEDMLGH